PGSIVLDGSTYVTYIEGGDGSAYSIGYQTSSTPGGSPTLSGSAMFDKSKFPNPDDATKKRTPENPKTFYYPPFSEWVMLVNLITPSGDYTDRNAILLNSSSTGFSTSTGYIIQSMYHPESSNALALGVVSHFVGPDGALISDNGYVPV